MLHAMCSRLVLEFVVGEMLSDASRSLPVVSDASMRRRAAGAAVGLLHHL